MQELLLKGKKMCKILIGLEHLDTLNRFQNNYRLKCKREIKYIEIYLFWTKLLKSQICGIVVAVITPWFKAPSPFFFK